MVNKELYDAYEAALSAVGETTRSAVVELVNRLVEVYGTEVVAGSLLEYVVSNYQALVYLYGDAAMQVVNEFYQTQRNLAGVETAYKLALTERVAPELVRYDVVSALEQSNGDLELLGSYLSQKAHDEVYSAADRQMNANLRSDPAKPKWALVAHAGACGWCRLMSSRGFQYYSEAKVEHVRHNNCKCTVAVDFDARNPILDGYDIGALEKEYEAAYKTAGTTKRADLTAAMDMAQGRNHNSPDYYYRVTKPKREAEKAARGQA